MPRSFLYETTDLTYYFQDSPYMTNEAQAAEPMKQGKQPVWKLLVALLLGAGLLFFAFRGIDFDKMMHYMQEINPLYLVLIFVIGILGHFLRALRWIILLKPVAERNVSLWNSFYAVILGYAVNVVIPKGGEVVRLVEMSRLEKLPWAAVAPTLLIDRLLDVALLALLVGMTLTVLPQSVLETVPWLVPGGVGMVVAATIGMVLLPKLSAIVRWFMNIEFIKKALPEKVSSILTEKLNEFEVGTKCLTNPVTFPIIAFLSAAIWACYWVSFYLMLFAFNMQAMVSATDCLITFTIGTLSNFVPTPGAAGGFHLLVQQGLMINGQVNKEQALAYATVLHIMNYIIVSCVTAAVCVLVQSFKKKSD